LNVTHGEMTSMKAKPRCAKPALIIGTSWVLSPEKLRATNVAPSVSAINAPSIGSIALASPFLAVDPLSADAENWPLVSP
jgi:hypothetical protein